jgi:hypothetical protein
LETCIYFANVFLEMKCFCSNCIAIEISGSIWPDSIMRWELRVRDVTRIQLSYSRAAAQCRNRKINNGAAGRRSKPVIQFIFFPPLSLFRSLIVFVCIPLERGLPDASRAAAITASFKLLDAAFDVTRHLVFSVLRKSHLNL